MYNYIRRIPLASISPLLTPLCLPFVPFLTPFYLLGTLLAVTGSVHLGLRLLVNWPPLSHPFTKPSPLQIPRTPITQRLTKTTSGRIRRLLSGTGKFTLLPHNQHTLNKKTLLPFFYNMKLSKFSICRYWHLVKVFSSSVSFQSSIHFN
jgi:hypothetical protein